MTDDDSIVFRENNQANRTNWAAICINPSYIVGNRTMYTQLYQPSYCYTNSYNKQTKKKTSLLKKKVLSNPLFTLTEMNESDKPIE